MATIVVREFARLTTGPVSLPSLDEATVTNSAFDWLCLESARLRKSGASLIQLEGKRWLRLDNYIGVLQTPCGTTIEILPKATTGDQTASDSRTLLRRMLAMCLDLPARESGPASIQTFDSPLTEWVMKEFLEALERLVKRGIRSGYHSVEDHQKFLRGRLLLARQLREPAGRQHEFHIEHDAFDANRPENRLLRSAVEKVSRITRNARNWCLSHELSEFLAPIPMSADYESDFRQWRHDRLLAHYKPVRPWCELILHDETPLSLAGEWRGNSLLFPMEKVFERYVGICLRKQLQPGAELISSASTKFLCSHRSKRLFQLKPDFMLKAGTRTSVIDTKWKMLDQTLDSSREKYGLSQADFYQLYAYGHKYMGGSGDMLLVYPKSSSFDRPLPVFELEPNLALWVVPFDLQLGELALENQPQGFSGVFRPSPKAA